MRTEGNNFALFFFYKTHSETETKTKNFVFSYKSRSLLSKYMRYVQYNGHWSWVKMRGRERERLRQRRNGIRVWCSKWSCYRYKSSIFVQTRTIQYLAIFALISQVFGACFSLQWILYSQLILGKFGKIGVFSPKLFCIRERKLLYTWMTDSFSHKIKVCSYAYACMTLYVYVVQMVKHFQWKIRWS